MATMTHMVILPGVPGGLGVQRAGRVFVACGEPLSLPSSWPALASAFLDVARDTGMIPCFAPIGNEFAALLDDLGLVTVRLGSTPYVHLSRWPQTGRPGARVREAVNRAKRDHLVFSHVSPGTGAAPQPAELFRWESEVQELSDDWLRRRRARTRFRWIFQLQPLSYPVYRRYFEARRDGRLVGLIAATPLAGREGWYLEDILRTASAPPSTTTALVSYALNTLKADGVKMATLGGVPLSEERGWDHRETTSLERLAYRLRPWLSVAYSFGGLELFKRRFGPAHWENEFLALPPGLKVKVQVILALVRLVLLGG